MPSKETEASNSMQDGPSNHEDEKPSAYETAQKASPKKRKASDAQTKEPSKASRRSSRGAPAASVDPVKLINFFLSEDSLKLCCPKDELSDLEENGRWIPHL